MPINLRDRLTFLFNGGKGIGTDQLDGTIENSQLADSSGIKTYFASGSVYTPASNTIAATIVGVDNSEVDTVSEFFFQAPGDMDRKADAMTLSIAGQNRGLLDVQGNAISARQLTPDALYNVFRYFVNSGLRYRMFEPLETRPQDYDIRAAVSEDTTFTDSEILSGTTSETAVITLPTWMTENHYVLVGVPDDTGDIIDLTLTGFSQFNGFARVAGARDVEGRDYKFWRSSNAFIPAFSGQSYTVVQEQ